MAASAVLDRKCRGGGAVGSPLGRYTHEVDASGEGRAELAERTWGLPRFSTGSVEVWERSEVLQDCFGEHGEMIEIFDVEHLEVHSGAACGPILLDSFEGLVDKPGDTVLA